MTKGPIHTDEERRLVLLLDADNTLWDTNRVFAGAQLALLDGVEAIAGRSVRAADRLGHLRRFDQEIARSHPKGLRYPPAMLIARLAADLGASPTPAEAAAVEAEYLARLRDVPPLLPTVSEGLVRAKASNAKLCLLTEGAKAGARTSLRHHRLVPFFERVVEMRKSEGGFARLQARFGGTCTLVVIGDQISRDIAPARAAGLHAIHVASDFRPVWENSPIPGPAAPNLAAAVALALNGAMS